MEIVAVVITECRLEYLHDTIQSFRKNIDYNFSDKIMINDSGQPESMNYLRSHFPEFKIISNQPKAGLAGSIRAAWEQIPFSTDYIFHLEEDFTFNEPIDIDQMARIGKERDLLQMLLKRQPAITHPDELLAGGYVEINPDLYEEHMFAGEDILWLEHENFFSLNPCLYPRHIVHVGWPDHGNEGMFYSALQQKYPGKKCGILGGKFDPPKVCHTGDNRSGEWFV